MIMLLIPRLLVAVAVMFIVTDVGVIAKHRPSSSWRFKPIPYFKSRSPDFQTTHQENIYRPYEHPIPYFKSRSPDFQTTHQENIYRPYEHPIPYFKSRSPDFQTTHEENIYRPYEHDLFSEIDSYVRKPSDEFNDDWDLFSGIDSYNRKPSDKNNDDSDALSRFLSFDRKPNDKNNDDSKMQKLMKPLETDHQVSTPSAPVNQKTTNGPPQSLEVTTRSAMIDGNITLVGLQQNSSEPNTTVKESHGQVLTTVPVVSSKADFFNINISHTKFISDLREMIKRLKQDQRRLYPSTPVNQKTPGETVEHNLQEKEFQTTKNLGQQQLPAEN